MHNEAERTAQGRTAAAGGLTPLLDRKATEIAARLRRLDAGRMLGRTLLGALGAGLLLVLVDRLVYVAPTVWLAATCGALVAAALGVSLAAWLLRPVSRFQGALAADEALGLKARLSSALEVAPLAGEPMVDGLLRDAEEHASRVRPAAVCPARWPLPAKLVPALAVLLVGAFFVPRLDLFQRQAVRDAEQARRTDNVRHAEENWQKLVQLARNAEKEKAKDAALTKMWSELRRKADEMRRDVHNRPELKDELLRLANMEKDVNKAYDRIEARRRMLEKLGRYQQDNAGASQSPALKQMAEALKNGDQEAAQKAADRLRDELEKALGSANGLTPEQRQDLSRQLKNLADAMNENPDLKQVAEKMNELADALQNLTDDQKEMLKEIRDLLSQMKSEFENLPDEADEMAKLEDLEEMLNNLEELRDMLRQMADMRQQAGGTPCPKCGKRSCGYCGGSRCDHTEHTNGQKCNCPEGGQPGQGQGQGQGPGQGGMGGKRIRMPGMGGGQSPGGQGGQGGQDGQNGGQNGQNSQGNPESNGPGMGGPGHGRGGVAPEKEHQTSSRMANINKGLFDKNGRLFTRDMFGEGAKGEALKEYQQIVREAQAAEEAAGEDQLPVPREYRQLIASYHDQILFTDGPPPEEPTRALDDGGSGKGGTGGNE